MSIPLERLDALWNATDAWLDLAPPEKRRRLVAQWEDAQGGLAPGSSADAAPPPPPTPVSQLVRTVFPKDNSQEHLVPSTVAAKPSNNCRLALRASRLKAANGKAKSG